MNFDEIELLFSRLQTTVAPAFSGSELAEVHRYIDVGEYGLALETAVDIFTEEKKGASAEVLSLVESLAELMLLDPEPLLDRLRSTQRAK